MSQNSAAGMAPALCCTAAAQPPAAAPTACSRHRSNARPAARRHPHLLHPAPCLPSLFHAALWTVGKLSAVRTQIPNRSLVAQATGVAPQALSACEMQLLQVRAAGVGGGAGMPAAAGRGQACACCRARKHPASPLHPLRPAASCRRAWTGTLPRCCAATACSEALLAVVPRAASHSCCPAAYFIRPSLLPTNFAAAPAIRDCLERPIQATCGYLIPALSAHPQTPRPLPNARRFAPYSKRLQSLNADILCLLPLAPCPYPGPRPHPHPPIGHFVSQTLRRPDCAERHGPCQPPALLS